MSKERIGFIGLGMMGLPMARNLIEGGYKVTVFDLDEESMGKAEESGASTSVSASETASKSDIVITMVPDSQHV